MNLNYTFSIVIPTFNRKAALSRCLNSLVSQSFKDFEVIVCDDGSTDDTDEIIELFKDQLNIKYIWNENWGGPARPRNIGLLEARGEWVCFLDSDDWYHSDRLQVLSTIINADYDVYHHKLIAIDDEGNQGRLYTRQINNANPAVDLLTCFNGILTSSSCIRREKLIESGVQFSENKDIIGLEDFDFWIQLGFKGFRFKLIRKNLGFYQVGGSDHITYEDQRQIKRFSVLYNSYYDRLDDRKKLQSSAAYKYQKACLLLNGSNKQTSLNYFSFALKHGSFQTKLRSVRRIIKLYV